MDNRFKYHSDLSVGSLLVRESRIVAALLQEKASPEKWDHAIRVENVLQKRSYTSARSYAKTIRKRLERLNQEFWALLINGDNELAVQTAFCGTLEGNLLLVEFIEDVLRDAYITHTVKLEFFRWLEFLEERAQRDPTIYDWKESTKKKMGQVAFRILREVGFITSTRTPILQQVAVRPEIRSLLTKYNKHRISKCLDVSNRSFQAVQE